MVEESHQDGLASKLTQPFSELREAGFDPEQILRVPPLEEFVSKFNTRYEQEVPFRELVHTYLGLDGFERFKLGLGKVFARNWHKRTTEGMVNEYASYVHGDLQKASDFYTEFKKLKDAEKAVREKEEEVQTARKQVEEIHEEQMTLVNEREQELNQRQLEYGTRLATEQERIRAEQERVKIMTDAKRLVQEKLTQRIKKSQLVTITKEGGIVFDDQKVAQKLEDLFLGQIIDDINQEDAGFMVRLRESFEGVVSHTDVIEGLEELPHVDWVQSLIYSRTRGFSRPVFPYFMVGKPEGDIERLVARIDTGIALDTSGSMIENKRFEIAQKATLATHALMRQLSPQNRMYLAQYSGALSEITTAQLMREVNPNGGTETYRALDWMREKLKDSPLAIAYLITDGYPNTDIIQRTIESARAYREHPNIMLRIFLIDPEPQSAEIIRSIGKAAGEQTKVMPIKNYQLANGVIKDIADTMGQMQSIGTF
ncbi:hypothetical protein HYZ97_04695 [Candidatus Pacearchaeota archaeon]|nr:hypothetical protein [Candidatus Pacearchaeota archaeon]